MMKKVIVAILITVAFPLVAKHKKDPLTGAHITYGIKKSNSGDYIKKILGRSSYINGVKILSKNHFEISIDTYTFDNNQNNLQRVKRGAIASIIYLLCIINHNKWIAILTFTSIK